MAKVVMIQGSMSSVGKSLITAGLCRVFKEDGLRVAPFKSQNMSRNSITTKDGLLMSGAQAIQAQASGVEPSVYMNPILLMPTGDSGSEVIVKGKSIGEMKAMDYFKYRPKLIPDIMDSFNRLSTDKDIILVEGAGSPAEINLRENDIVNMGLANLLDAPVILVGDIDRGGVFAQLVGTMELLSPEERAKVKGFIINKFRGDKKLLSPGLSMLTEKTGIPVLGVLPYFSHNLPEEDSLSERLTLEEREKLGGETKGNDSPEDDFARLANLIRENIDMDAIYGF